MRIAAGRTYIDRQGKKFYVHAIKAAQPDLGLSESAIIEDVTTKNPRGKEFPWARWILERDFVSECP
jgi:hypothetical protein